MKKVGDIFYSGAMKVFDSNGSPVTTLVNADFTKTVYKNGSRRKCDRDVLIHKLYKKRMYLNSAVSFATGSVATTPDAYALTQHPEGSMIYVTSAHKYYIRGASTWEAITSAI